jgi:hypothetical protein
VLNSDDRYAPYHKSVKYIATELNLTDDDLDPDTGRYDEDVLEEAAEKAVERYVKNAPKPAATRQSGGAGGPGGEPGRGGTQMKKSDAQKLDELDDALGGVFSRNGMIRR